MSNNTKITITKNKLASAIKREVGLNNKDSLALVTDMIKIMTDSLLAKKIVKIRGFGSFIPAIKSYRVSRNPKTLELAPITKWNTIRFKIAPSLKKMILNITSEISNKDIC